MKDERAGPVKSSWITRRFPPDLAITWDRPHAPQPGHVLMAQVVRLGLHGRIETITGARQKLYPGDRFVCTLAARYATSLLEATPDTAGNRADMVSASGICGTVTERTRKAANPSEVRLVAQAFVDGEPLSLRSIRLPAAEAARGEPQWVVVVGSAMDSGKTTACASIIRGLAASGRRVGAAKLTGTASGRDFGAFRDAGAAPVFDFLDAGWASTAGCSPAEVREVVDLLADHLRAASVQWAVLEIADGLLQPETNDLLGWLPSRLGSMRVVVTARESMAAVAAVERLTSSGYDVSAVSGLVTNSPLACREVELASPARCVPTAELGRLFVETDVALHRAPVGLGTDALGVTAT